MKNNVKGEQKYVSPIQLDLVEAVAVPAINYLQNKKKSHKKLSDSRSKELLIIKSIKIE